MRPVPLALAITELVENVPYEGKKATVKEVNAANANPVLKTLGKTRDICYKP